MRKWVLVAGLTGCCVLFLVSGAFLGYLTSGQKAQEMSKEKPKRKPSDKLDKMPEPILGHMTHTQEIVPQNSKRAPSKTAVIKAQQYNS